MSVKSTNDIISMNGCVIRDENGVELAIVEERNLKLFVKRYPCCSIGTYFYIINHLREMGFFVE